jgi:surfeit locus 1 family protein
LHIDTKTLLQQGVWDPSCALFFLTTSFDDEGGMKRIIFFVLFGLGGMSILISLGIWQMQRLAWKQVILTQIEERIVETPVALPANPDPVDDKYLSVTAEGFVKPEFLRVLVSQKRIGAGYKLISPFVLEGRTVLLDRGFISVNDDLPGEATIAVQSVVTGNLHWPQETDGYTPAPDIEKNIWFARDVEAMAAILKTDPVMIVLREISPGNAGVTPLPVDTVNIPNDHLQYAITWFLLALIWGAMTAYFLLRTGRGPTET